MEMIVHQDTAPVDSAAGAGPRAIASGEMPSEL